jgi:hypothetical protein
MKSDPKNPPKILRRPHYQKITNKTPKNHQQSPTKTKNHQNRPIAGNYIQKNKTTKTQSPEIVHSPDSNLAIKPKQQKPKIRFKIQPVLRSLHHQNIKG